MGRLTMTQPSTMEVTMPMAISQWSSWAPPPQRSVVFRTWIIVCWDCP